MYPVLRLYEDVLANDAPEVGLPPLPRLIFVVHGALTIEGRVVGDGEAWHSEGEAMVEPGRNGVTCWRFELVGADAGSGALKGGSARSLLKLSAALETLPAGDLLLRGDSVAFPPGRLKLATRPSCTGSPGVVNTMGIFVVAAFAAR
jgi:hypothetical protein